jgi:hypothetical protein
MFHRLLRACLPLVALACAWPLETAAETFVVADTEFAFLAFLDAHSAVGLLESGLSDRYEGRDLANWTRVRDERRRALFEGLAAAGAASLPAAEAQAVAAMRHSVESLEADQTTTGVQARTCTDAERRDLDYADLRAALVSCFVEYGNRLRFEDRTVDRSTARQMLHVLEGSARRKALFDAFVPLWSALNGRNEPDSPYRRMMAMAAADAAKRGSEIDAAARSIGVETAEVEHWLTRALEAWREVVGPQQVEPWDYSYLGGEANRRLEPKLPAEALLPANERFYRDLGADLGRLGIVFDLAPRPDKSPLAYTDFLTRGRTEAGHWRPSVARVVGTYPSGGLFSLNELVHENGHAVHVSGIRNRPAYLDWPADTLLVEAFADVPSWSVYEPAWQRRYLGMEVPEATSLRALFSDVMLDVAWSLFEVRLLRDPKADPNAVWTEITSRYLGIVPHPEVPWWAMRVQLVGNPGYMVNYGLGAVLTADMRQRVAQAIGPFDAGNPAWYGWVSEQLLRYGSERAARSLLQELLGRPVSPAALLQQLGRCR